MYISINESSGWGTSGAVFDCIFEGTRALFTCDQYSCMRKIYEALDEQAQSFIILDNITVDCFNLFYSHCEAAMKIFTDSDRGKMVPENHIPAKNWGQTTVTLMVD